MFALRIDVLPGDKFEAILAALHVRRHWLRSLLSLRYDAHAAANNSRLGHRIVRGQESL